MIRLFTQHKILSGVFAVALCITTTNYACNADKWISVIGEYLPVALQIAQSIASLVGILAPNSSAADQAAVKAIGDEATKDFQLLQSLYNQYESTPSPNTKAEIENALAVITSNLPAELAAAHITNSDLVAKVTAAVNILMTVADIIIAQIPTSNPKLLARKVKSKAAFKQSPMTIKSEWDSLVCSGNSACIALVR